MRDSLGGFVWQIQAEISSWECFQSFEIFLRFKFFLLKVQTENRLKDLQS